MKNIKIILFFVSLAPIRHYSPEPDTDISLSHVCAVGSIHEPVLVRNRHGSNPSEDLSEPPSLPVPASYGAVTGRKYHCRLFRIMAGGLPQAALGWTVPALHL